MSTLFLLKDAFVPEYSNQKIDTRGGSFIRSSPPYTPLLVSPAPFHLGGLGLRVFLFLKEWNDVPDFLFHPLSDADSVFRSGMAHIGMVY